MEHRAIGKFNSSITRVRPLFQRLLSADATGQSWLPKILKLGTDNQKLARTLSINTGPLVPEVVDKRSYRDRVLKAYGIDEIQLQNCFEKSLPPAEQFLRWLITHTAKMMTDRNITSGAAAKRLRENLFGYNGVDTQRASTIKAISELDRLRAKGSRRKWWAFEGFTEVDCYLETENLVLLIEGKRTEPLSSATMWYPERNQIIRNLEVARETAAAKRKDHAVLLIAEKIITFDLMKEAKAGLPHLNQKDIEEISNHYLGCTTWPDVCEATGLLFSELPDTTEEVVTRMRRVSN